MFKFLLKFFIFLFLIILLVLIYLSYFGIETNKFDSLIKSKANEVSRHIKLDFQKTKIHVSLKELDLVVRLQQPKVLVKENEIKLSKLNLFLPLKSFFSSDFLLKKGIIAFEKNNIKDLTKVTSIFLPRTINKRLNKIFVEGNLEGEFILRFKTDGTLDKNYGFVGKISDALIKITKEFSLRNLTTEISNNEGVQPNDLKIKIIKGLFLDLELDGSNINLTREKNNTKINSLLHTNGKANLYQIKMITSIFGKNINFLKDMNIEADIFSNISFDLANSFKVKNLVYATDGNIKLLNLETNENKVVKAYLPLYKSKISIKDSKAKFEKDRQDYILELNGLMKINNEFNNFNLKNVYSSTKKDFTTSGKIDLTDSEVKISKLNYNKENKINSSLSFNVNYIYKDYYNIKEIKYLADENYVHLSNIFLNKKFEITDINYAKIRTYINKIKNNDFEIIKSKKIEIKGEILDLQPMLKSIYKKNKRKTLSKSFNAEVEANVKKTIAGPEDEISNFSMTALINKGNYTKLNLEGNFSKNELLNISINQINEDEKLLKVVSDRARPFMSNFQFIKGFEGGKLDYDSVIMKSKSEANLKITDFKVSKVPALAKLLTLASLKGIADTLSGEGINFEILEMKSISEGNIFNIEEAYAYGPAVSILLDGYVDKGKTVSLRGTLIPARFLNSIINKIPIVGKILVGEKSGEGVVGVSFKMKGPPKKIKTTVNPIKTLTPRFIIRVIERMKKEKKAK
ncbi:MAG TPA: hypothetical protein EYQ38_04265 [Candidatus Pelagibacter sp.]|nr:hypothetical protein [Candidatus Pelagibacter sp.]